MRRRVVLRALATLACVTLPLAGACGKKGPPLAPLPRLPVAPAQVSASRAGDTVTIRFTVPGANVSGVRPADIERVDVYAWTGPDVPAARVFKVAKVVASVQVRRPPPPPDPDEDGNVPPPPPPVGPGVDQGAATELRETLAPDAFLPVDVSNAKKRTPAPDGEPKLTPPDAMPVPSPLTRRYIVVGVNHGGQRGRAAPPLAVPLWTAPPPPACCHGKGTPDGHGADLDGAASRAPPRPGQRDARQDRAPAPRAAAAAPKARTPMTNPRTNARTNARTMRRKSRTTKTTQTTQTRLLHRPGHVRKALRSRPAPAGGRADGTEPITGGRRASGRKGRLPHSRPPRVNARQATRDCCPRALRCLGRRSRPATTCTRSLPREPRRPPRQAADGPAPVLPRRLDPGAAEGDDLQGHARRIRGGAVLRGPHRGGDRHAERRERGIRTNLRQGGGRVPAGRAEIAGGRVERGRDQLDLGRQRGTGPGWLHHPARHRAGRTLGTADAAADS